VIPARPVVGLIVNPIAGMGGRMGLKGTDGAATLERARSLGAMPGAPARADGVEATLRSAGVGVRRVTPEDAAGTSAAARDLAADGTDLLLFVGGDGTARDVWRAVGMGVTVLGVPSGVKMHSAAFATGPAAAAAAALAWLASAARRTREAEVVDIDEDAVRSGRMDVRLYGVLRVPDVPGRLQSLKAGGDVAEAAVLAGLAADVVARLEPGSLVVLGPGTTVHAVGATLGVTTTLLGVDAVEVTAGGRGRIVALDAGEAQLLAALAGRPATAVLSPTGGQGFLLGRGNQQLSPAVLRAIGPDRVLVVATATKLAALGTNPLYVDTGDAALDADFAGYRRVVTGRGREAVVRIAVA
jgi:predicted polyphosphate/ATP-dependent NAD kinase